MTITNGNKIIINFAYRLGYIYLDLFPVREIFGKSVKVARLNQI